jgi:hypothetical protein
LLAVAGAIHELMTSQLSMVMFGLLVAMRTDPMLAGQDLLPEGDPVSRAIARGELRSDADRSLLLRVAVPLIDAELMLTGGLASRSCPAWSTTSSSPAHRRAENLPAPAAWPTGLRRAGAGDRRAAA